MKAITQQYDISQAHIRLGGLLAMLACLIVLATPVRADHAHDRLHVNTGHNPPLATDDNRGFHDRVVIEAYRRASYEISLTRLPSARSMQNLNLGIDVGNGPRVQGMETHFPNVRIVPEKIIDFDFVAFAIGEPPNPVRTWEDLADLDVGIVAGWKILEVNITKSRSLTKVRTPDQMFALLQSGRADVVVIERWQGLHIAQEMGMTDLVTLDPPLVSKAMYLYVHQSRDDLIEPLVRSIREMKADGTYQAFFDDTLSELVQ